MSLFIFLFVLQAIVAAALVGVVLMQRSEGGGLGIGGSPTGVMSARGAADFLSRATKWLAVAFVILSIALAVIAAETTGQDSITSTLDRSITSDPLGQADGGAQQPAAPATQPAGPTSDDPLADVTE